MFLVKAGTVIQIEAPKSRDHFNWAPWIPYTTKEDKFYDKHEVLDAISVRNSQRNEMYTDRRLIPDWAEYLIVADAKTILCVRGKYALVPNDKIEFVD